MATLQSLNFVPTSIAGCRMWLDANDSTTVLVSGGVVSQWNDKSGNGNNATPGVAPTYASSGIVFNGSTQYLVTPLNATSLATSQFIVFRYTYAASSMVVMGGTALNSLLFQIIGTTSISTGDWSTAGYTNTDLLSGSANILAQTSNSTRINGNTPATGSVSIGGGGATFTIGAGYTDNRQKLNGTIYEILSYNSVLTTSQRQQVEGYLAWKWGLVGNLPSSHPYKLIGPNSAGLAYPSGLTVPIPRQSFTPSSTPLVFGFSPTSIPGCILWLDGADSNSVTLSGSNVTVWKDKSTAANNVTTVTGTPTYTSSGINLSRTSSDLMRTTNSISFATGATTIFYVAQVQTVGGLQDFMAFPDAGTVAVRYNNGLLATVGDANDFGNNSYYVNGTFNPTITTTSTYTSRHLVSAQNQYISGNARATLSDSFASRYTSGTYNEVIFFSAPLSTAQRQQVEGYLAWKWGVQASLPANHPYKNIVPGLTFNVPIPLYALQGASFTPRSISGLSLWLDAADNASLILSGSTVSQWNDKSGNGRNATASTAPNYLSNGVYFTSNQRLVTSLSASSTTESAFFVCKFDSFVNGNTLFGGSIMSGGRKIRVLGGVIQSIKQNVVNVVSTGATLAANVVHLIEFVNNGNTLTHYWNGSFYASGATVAYDAAITTTIGSSPDSASDYMNGFLYEIVTVSAALSTNQRQTVEGYLAWKWGLAANLPATHPFKKYTPPPS